MTSTETSPVRRLAPSLFLAGLLALVSACATAPPRPPAPISSGAPRAEPITEAGTDQADSEAESAETEVAELDDLEDAEPTDDGYTPPHMVGREITRLAVLLPFSHPNANVRREAEGMLAGIELALFNADNDNILLMPKDTAGTASGAVEQLNVALGEGADVVIGPLFAANVRAVRNVAAEAGVPVIGFSNDPTAAGGGSVLISIAPEEQVSSVVDHAVREGVQAFAFLGPNNNYGRRIEAALRQKVNFSGGYMLISSFYSPTNDAPVDEAKQVADAIVALQPDKEDPRPVGIEPEKIAVMVPERGVKLRAVAPLLPYYGVDTRFITLMGAGGWDDPGLWREPTLNGGIFAGPAPEVIEPFNTAFERNYARTPTPLASLGYDAAALAIQLSEQQALGLEGLSTPDGFFGVNGLFRFRDDGTAQRGLTVYEINTRRGAVVVAPGATSFTPAG